MTPSHTPRVSDRIRPARPRVTRPRRLATLASVGAALAMAFGGAVPASADVGPSPSPTDPASVTADLPESPSDPSASVDDYPVGYFVYGRVVGSSSPVLVEVLETPKYGETGTFTVQYT